MKNECSIVRDLLPLYAENMVSMETAAYVKEHLERCESCKKEYEQIQKSPVIPQTGGAAPLQTLSRKLKIKRIQTAALTAVFVIALMVSAFAMLSAPVFLPYSEELVTVEPYSDTEILLTFDESITDFYCIIHDDPDDSSVCRCDIEAWTTLWDKWFAKGNEALSTTVAAPDKPMLLSYVPNDGSENICLAKYDPDAQIPIETVGKATGIITLPRLALGYYLILASAALAVIAAVWFFTKNKPNARIWVERIGLYPAAYIVSHCIVSGINWATHSMSRDLSLIVFLSVLLYSGFLLAHNIWYLRKEIRESNGG